MARGEATVVQDPDTAVAGAMPRAALARGAADFVMPLPGIASLLAGARPPPEAR